MKIIQSDKVPEAIGPYSQAIEVNGSISGLIFCSGQVGVNRETGEIAVDIEGQTKQVLENLKAVLVEAGSGVEKIVKTTVYLANLDDFANMNFVYSEFFGDHKPARATVEVARLPQGNLDNKVLVEIDAIAA